MRHPPPGTKISADHLEQLPYVALVPEDGRIVPLIGLFEPETEEWHTYIPHSNKELIRLRAGDMTNGSYLGKARADSTNDIEWPLGTLVVGRLSFPDVLGALGPLENDIHRCAQVLRKYELFWEHRGEAKSFAGLLVESELEYLLLLLRSYYDALQNVVRAVARHPLAENRNARRLATQGLPSTFSAIVKDSKSLPEPSSLSERYGMHEALTRWYQTEAPFFRALKSIRDGIAHYGRRPPIVFETEWGFAVNPAHDPWTHFNVWPEERYMKDRLGSLRRLIACFILHALGATSRLAIAIGDIVELPSLLDEDLRLFVRSPFGERLVYLEAVAAEPWEGSRHA